MREAWKQGSGKHVRSQSFSSESERKIQISPPLGEQDQSNALPQGQQRQIPTPCPAPPPPPAGLTIIGALTESKMNKTKKGKINKI